jgi:hypothetical protein
MIKYTVRRTFEAFYSVFGDSRTAGSDFRISFPAPSDSRSRSRSVVRNSAGKRRLLVAPRRHRLQGALKG